MEREGNPDMAKATAALSGEADGGKSPSCSTVGKKGRGRPRNEDKITKTPNNTLDKMWKTEEDKRAQTTRQTRMSTQKKEKDAQNKVKEETFKVSLKTIRSPPRTELKGRTPVPPSPKGVTQHVSEQEPVKKKTEGLRRKLFEDDADRSDSEEEISEISEPTLREMGGEEKEEQPRYREWQEWLERWASEQEEKEDRKMVDLEDMLRRELARQTERTTVKEVGQCNQCAARREKVKELESELELNRERREKAEEEANKEVRLLQRKLDSKVQQLDGLMDDLIRMKEDKTMWKARALQSREEVEELLRRERESEAGRHEKITGMQGKEQSHAEGVTPAHEATVSGGWGAPEAGDTRSNPEPIREVPKPKGLTEEE